MNLKKRCENILIECIKMEIQQLNEVVDILQNTIAEFPVGANTPDDFKPIEEKIVDLRESIKAINARSLTLKAVIDYGLSDGVRGGDINQSLEKLHESTTNYLVNTQALKLCYHSRAIQDAINKKAAKPEIVQKMKSCLNKLFIANDKLILNNERKKELMKKQYNLKLECHRALYSYQDFLKEKEAKRKQQLQENNPNMIQFKEKIDKSIFKIYTMKKLVTNLVASMFHEVHDNKDLIEMLVKHKETITYETIKEMTQNQSSTSS